MFAKFYCFTVLYGSLGSLTMILLRTVMLNGLLQKLQHTHMSTRVLVLPVTSRMANTTWKYKYKACVTILCSVTSRPCKQAFVNIVTIHKNYYRFPGVRFIKVVHLKFRVSIISYKKCQAHFGEISCIVFNRRILYFLI